MRWSLTHWLKLDLQQTSKQDKKGYCKIWYVQLPSMPRLKNSIPIWQVSPDLRETGGLGGDNMTAVLATWLQNAVCGFFVRLNHWKRWLCTLCEKWLDVFYIWLVCIVLGSVLYHRWSRGCAQKPWGPRGWHLEVSVGSLNSRCRKMVWHGNVQVVSVVPSR